MIKVINIILALVCIALAYFLFVSISNPVKYKNQIEERNQAVYNQLYEIRDAQEAFKTLHGKYANEFDTLKQVLRTGQFSIVDRISQDTTRVSVIDSLYDGNASQINDLSIVPNSGGEEFELDSGVLPSPSDSTVYVNVFEASTMNDVYLGGENGINQDYWRAGQKVKIGSLTAPILTGNWE